MGIVLDTIGVNHKLRTDDPLSLIKELSAMHRVNIEVVYELDLEEELRFENVYSLHTFDGEKSVYLVLPECVYLTDFYHREKSFRDLDWQSDELKSVLLGEISTHHNPYIFTQNCFDGTEIYYQNLLLETVDLTHCFSTFCTFFQGGEIMSKNEWDHILSFRQKVKSECEKWGCDFAVYYPSYGERSAVLVDHLGDSMEQLMEFIQKEFFNRDSLMNDVVVDISSFIMSNQSPFSNDIKLNIFIDDFNDLK